MEGDRIGMSQRERDRLKVMSLVLEGKRTQREAGRLLSLSELRHDQAISRTPVIILTGVGEKTGVRFSKSDVGDFMGEEPDAYVEKPVDPKVLQETVRGLLGG